MRSYQWLGAAILSVIGTAASASTMNVCVFDVMGANGITMSIMKDYALAAKGWGVEVQPKVYTKLSTAQQDFEQKKCQAIVADNFATRKYNLFMGTVGAIGAVPNYEVGQRVLLALASPKLSAKLKNNHYEVMGYMPYGLVYLMAKDRNINSLDKFKGLRIGVLADDPSQSRMAQKVGMKPVVMTFDNAASKFRNNDMDIVPAPLLIWEPFEGAKLLGANGAVANYPMSFMTMNFIVANGNYPKDLGQKSREWFSKASPRILATVKSWDAKVPEKYWMQIPDIDRPSYDHLASQLRKEFIDGKVYDVSMMTLIRHLRCAQNPKFVECKK